MLKAEVPDKTSDHSSPIDFYIWVYGVVVYNKILKKIL